MSSSNHEATFACSLESINVMKDERGRGTDSHDRRSERHMQMRRTLLDGRLTKGRRNHLEGYHRDKRQHLSMDRDTVSTVDTVLTQLYRFRNVISMLKLLNGSLPLVMFSGNTSRNI